MLEALNPGFPLAAARHAHEFLGKGGVTGKIVLVHNASPA